LAQTAAGDYMFQNPCFHLATQTIQTGARLEKVLAAQVSR
jgi:hypothetical protein